MNEFISFYGFHPHGICSSKKERRENKSSPGSPRASLAFLKLVEESCIDSVFMSHITQYCDCHKDARASGEDQPVLRVLGLALAP
jgi:hypothetical protein